MSFHVGVIKRPDCANLVMRFKHPVSGKWTCKTKYIDPTTGEVTETGTNRKFAERLAARWEADLNAGRSDPGRHNISWEGFRQQYEDAHLPSLAQRTAEKANTTFNAVERILPRIAKGKLSDLDAEALTLFQSTLRDGERSEDTIKGYLSYLKAALGWAVGQGMIAKVPTIISPRRAKKRGGGCKAKGRAPTLEEFERMLAAVPIALGEWRKRKREAARKTSRKHGKAERKTQTDAIPVEVSPAAVASWQYYLRGLWLSGLRRAESIELYWDRPDRLCIDLDGKRPRLRIPGALEKGHRDRLLPLTPDFATFLLETPEADRHGPVFRPLMPSGQRANEERAGRMISLIGGLARVVVHTDPKTGAVKYASAHDLRRSFGTRWAKRVKTPVLMRLMRHESIATTMGYYVDLDCDEIAEELWQSSAVSVPVAPSGDACEGRQNDTNL